MREGVGVAFQVHQMQCAGDQIFALRFGKVLVAQAEVEVLPHGLPWEQRKLLKHDGAVGTGAGDLLAIEADGA